jgi:hypothetical protein
MAPASPVHRREGSPRDEKAQAAGSAPGGSGTTPEQDKADGPSGKGIAGDEEPTRDSRPNVTTKGPATVVSGKTGEARPLVLRVVIEAPETLRELGIDVDVVNDALRRGLATRSENLVALREAALAPSAMARVRVRDDVYLDLERLDTNGVVITASYRPAYRVAVRSRHGRTFGSGIYGHGEEAMLGVEDPEVAAGGVAGTLGAQVELEGWRGIDADGERFDVEVTRPVTVEAAWRHDITVPAVILAIVALIGIALFTPSLVWTGIELTLKATSEPAARR